MTSIASIADRSAIFAAIFGFCARFSVGEIWRVRPRPVSARLAAGGRLRARIALRPMRRALLGGLVVGGAVALPSSASAMTWSGAITATAVGPVSANWSNPSNWADWANGVGTISALTSSTLNFPVLSSPACTASPPTGACYASTNDVSGLNVSGISIDDGAPYQLGGNAITLAAGGITARPSTGETDQGFPSLGVPISLGAPQTWSITGGPENQQLEIGAPVTGHSDALAIGLSNQTVLGLYADDEVGPVRVTSSGTGAPSTVQLGGLGTSGSLNGTDANPVSFSGAGLLADPGTVGPLTMTGGQLEVGTSYQAGTLAVSGGATLDSTSTLSAYIPRSGTRPGTDFSQLSATGTVNLGNAQLSLGGQTIAGEVPSCPVLTPGDVDTLVTTTGSLTGTFAGVPDGTTIPIDCPAGSIRTPPTVKIDYTAHTVTATVETSDGVATATTLSPPNPASVVTNQAVTLTASVSAGSGSGSRTRLSAGSKMSVSAGSGTPAGRVEFDDNGTAIAGCSNRPLALDGTATCQTAFTAASPAALSAVFEPADSSSFYDSTSAPVNLAVGKDSTTTTLTASSSTPAAGASVIYTATVTPADAGATEPSDSVQFLDGGTAIDSCASQPLTAGPSSSVATCTLSYPAGGSHNITATYLGDGDFAISTSTPPQIVTVRPATGAAATGAPAIGAAAIGAPATGAPAIGAPATGAPAMIGAPATGAPATSPPVVAHQTSGVTASGRLGVKLTCGGSPCSGTMKLTAASKRTTRIGKRKKTTTTIMTIGSVSFSGLAGGAHRISLRLNKTGFRLLKQGGYRLIVTVVVTYKSGSTTKTIRSTITLT
jgi:hypothetical protein